MAEDSGHDPHDPTIVAARPEAERSSRFKIDWTKLFIAATKTVIDTTFGSLVNAAKSAVEVVGAFGKASAKELSAEQQGWVLIQRAIVLAVAWTVRGRPAKLGALADSETELKATLDGLMAAEVAEITPIFFDQPADSALFHALRGHFRRWLAVIGCPEVDHDQLCRALDGEFVLALDIEERQNRDDYGTLTAYFQPTLASPAAKRERDWRRYRARLVADTRRPLFNLSPEEPAAVTLQDVYVPLRGWYEEAVEDEDEDEDTRRDRASRQPPRRLVWLRDHIMAWLDARNPQAPLRVISGEPGCGKSAFSRMLAAELARAGHKALYVPIHRIDFQGDARAALGGFAKLKDELGHDPLEDLEEDRPLLVIFDGLDELSKASERAGETARSFVEHLDRCIGIENHGRPRLFALVAGRPMATEASTAVYRAPGERLHIFRFYQPDLNDQSKYLATDAALRADQRDEWWQKFGRATGQVMVGRPQRYRDKGRNIDEITAQPLLNYLLALLSKMPEANTQNIGNAHSLYRHMFDYIYQRPHHGPDRGRRPAEQLSKANYRKVLEAIAVAAWHTGDRAVKYADAQFRLEQEGLGSVLQKEFKAIDAGLFAVLNEFFAEPREDAGFHTFEFTHKSFREYLTACRIGREIKTLHRKLRPPEDDEDAVDILTPDKALGRWLALCGPTAMDADLFAFLVEEIRGDGSEPHHADLTAWQDTLADLFSRVLRDGFPLVALISGQTSRDLIAQAVNAEEALLAALDACAGSPPRRSQVRWPDQWAFWNLMHRFAGRPDGDPYFVNWRLASLFTKLPDGQPNVSVTKFFFGLILENASLGGSNLTGANLTGVNLTGADLSRTDLTGANLIRANLSHTDLTGANLSSAYMSFSDLTSANLSGADLSGANLRGTDLTGADLRHANLRGANLRHTDLTGANLSRANLSGSNLSGSNLNDRNLTGVDLSPAAMSSADLSGADLSGSDLTYAVLANINLKESNIVGCDMFASELQGTRISKSQFGTAKTIGARGIDKIIWVSDD